MAATLVFAGCRSARAEKLAGDPLGGIALTAQDGRPFASSEYRGKTLVLSFFFTSCPVVCPAQAKLLRDVWHALPQDVRERVEFVSVSVDPENDTPEALARFARQHQLELDGFTLARADDAATHALTTRLAAVDASRPEGALPSGHTTAIYLFEPRGRLMQRYGAGTEAVRLAREVRQIDTMSRSGS